jgi:hypothetical protein
MTTAAAHAMAASFPGTTQAEAATPAAKAALQTTRRTPRSSARRRPGCARRADPIERSGSLLRSYFRHPIARGGHHVG